MIHCVIKILGVIMGTCFVAAATGAQPLAESRRLERPSKNIPAASHREVQSGFGPGK